MTPDNARQVGEMDAGNEPEKEKANEEQRKSWEAYNTNFAGLTADALLYLGPRAGLTRSPTRSDLYLDQDFRSEIDRRNRIMTGGSRRRFSAVAAPEVTPTIPRNPAFDPACKSSGVSPTATTSATLLTRAASMA